MCFAYTAASIVGQIRRVHGPDRAVSLCLPAHALRNGGRVGCRCRCGVL